jgi:hypothetical protein
VELDVLPRGHVAVPARLLGGDVRQRVELIGREDPLRDLDPKHVDVVLPLPVGAARQPETAELLGAQLAALVPREPRDEVVDVRDVREGEQLCRGAHHPQSVHRKLASVNPILDRISQV